MDAMKFFCLLLVCVAVSCSTQEENGNTTSTTTTTAPTTTTTTPTPKLPKVQVTRTALHVARSLDPESTETVNVRTRTGDIATLIVRKRGGKSNPAIPAPVSIRSKSIRVEDEREEKAKGLPPFLPTPSPVKSSSLFVQDEDHERTGKTAQDVINIVEPPKNLSPPSSLAQLVRQLSDNNKREEKNIRVPPPVYVRSEPMAVKGEQPINKGFWNRARSVMHIDSDGIPVIHGVRMPDDESDRQTWRNARVINGILVPNDKPKTEDDSGDKQEIVRKVTVHLEDPATKKKPTEASSQFQPSPYLEHTVKKKHQQYNFPYASDTHARILEYINTVNQRETEKRGKIKSRARMVRFPASRRSDDDDESQGRVLQYPGSSIYPTSLLYTPPSQKTSRISFEEGVRTPVLQYAHPELGVQPAKVMRKLEEGEEVEETQQDPKFNEGGKGNSLTLAYFGQDIHSDRSPYAFEPGMEANEEKTEATPTESSIYDKRSSSTSSSINKEDLATDSTSHQWPKNSLAYLHQQTSEDTYGLGNDKYIKRFPYHGYNNVHSGSNKDGYNRYKGSYGGSSYSRYPHGYGHHAVYAHSHQERPFWERIGDSIREHVQTSMEKVSDITRPVVEPLVEATHKISHNLGLGGEGNRNVIQDKVGSTVAAYPVLLPALGLVAGGAALGLGAVAVGRYLDVDVMKRRIGLREDSSDELSVEHKRALERIMQSLGHKGPIHEEGTWVVAEEFKNPDEQKKVLESAARALNDRKENGDQDDTQRKAMEAIVRTLADKHTAREGQWLIADNPVKEVEAKLFANAMHNLKDERREERDRGAWLLVKNYRPNQDDQHTYGRQVVWSRADNGRRQDEQEKKALETIVGKLAEEEGIGHREGSWIVTEESTQGQDQQRRQVSWSLNKDRVSGNEEQVKSKRSPDEEVIYVIEQDPKIQAPRQIIVPQINVGNTHFRTKRDISHRVLASIGQESSTNEDRDVLNEQTPRVEQHNFNHHLTKRVIHNSQTTNKREKEIDRLEGGDQYLDNILHSLESSQQEILASMARLDDRHHHDWSNTLCAKKIFCDVMVKQPADAVMLMEKKMATFLSLIQPNEAVSYHLGDVMDAVKRHDCSAFTCPSVVDSSRVETPYHGPGPR